MSKFNSQQAGINPLFGGFNVPSHTHNGIDSPLIKSNSLGSVVYGGLATTAGTATSLPAGWSIAGGVAGQCTITHNLGTTAYAVVATVLPQNTITIVNIDSVGANSFFIKTNNQTGSVTWTATNTQFFFVLVLT